MSKIKLLAGGALLAALASTSVSIAADIDTNPVMQGSLSNFTECAAVRMKEVALKHIAAGDSKNTTTIPAGWTVVGGTGGDGHPKILICR